MSAFDDFNTLSQAEAFEVLGPSSVTIAGYTDPFDALVDQFATRRELDLDGSIDSYDGTAYIQLASLSGIAAPIERTLEGKQLTVDGRTFRIEAVHVDSAGATLGLKSEQAHNPPLGRAQGM